MEQHIDHVMTAQTLGQGECVETARAGSQTRDCATVEKRLDDLQVPCRAGEHERRHPFKRRGKIRRVRAAGGPVAQQLAHNRSVAAQHCPAQPSEAMDIGRVRGHGELRTRAGLPGQGHVVQHRPEVQVGRLDCPSRQQHRNRFCMSSPNCHLERRRAAKCTHVDIQPVGNKQFQRSSAV